LIHAVILAGGASTRMGRPKALLVLDGETFMARLVRRFHAAGCAQITVVGGADDAQIRPAVPERAVYVYAPNWADGMRASLRVGLGATLAGDVLLTHVDRPLMSSETLMLLTDAGGGLIPTYDGRGGHPIRLPAALRPRIMQPDDAPLKTLLGEVRRQAVDDAWVRLNVNTPAAYADLIATRG
jgi:molybdenum cofactor cytidylyltransferase